MTTIITKDNIPKARLLILRSALRLETLGMKRRGQSVYSVVKKEFGFKGNKAKVLAQLDDHISNNI